MEDRLFLCLLHTPSSPFFHFTRFNLIIEQNLLLLLQASI